MSEEKNNVELRKDANDDLDELIVHGPKSIHFEVINDEHLWCAIYLADGKRRIVVDIMGNCKLSWSADIEKF
jgi:hypothetical protein